MFYDVEVSRISTANKVIRVEADSPEDAEKKALAAAGDEDFAGCVTDYEFEANSVEPVADPSVPPSSMNIEPGESREVDNLTDAKGRKLPREDVEELAMEKIIASGEASKGAALDAYIENMGDETLLKWATDVDGNFPDRMFRPETCDLCRKVMPEIKEAINQGWVPSYWDGDEECSGPVCPDCVAKYLDTEYTSLELVLKELKGEYVSDWGNGHEFRSPCTVNVRTRSFTIEQSFDTDESVDDPVEEYVMLDGNRYAADHADRRDDYSPAEQAQMFFWG